MPIDKPHCISYSTVHFLFILLINSKLEMKSITILVDILFILLAIKNVIGSEIPEVLSTKNHLKQAIEELSADQSSLVPQKIEESQKPTIFNPFKLGTTQYSAHELTKGTNFYCQSYILII